MTIYKTRSVGCSWIGLTDHDRTLPPDPSISDLARQHRDERLEQFEGCTDPENAYLFRFRKIVKQGRGNY